MTLVAQLLRVGFVFRVCNPFQIISSVIGWVAINMIYLWFPLWIWYKQLGHQSVNLDQSLLHRCGFEIVN